MSSVSPDEILNKRFSVTLRRGYEKEEVDGFLLEVADTLRDAQHAAARATDVDPFEALGEQVAGVLRAANETAEKLRSQAAEEANTIRRRAAEKAMEIRRQAQLKAEGALERVRKEAQAASQEAESHAARVRQDADRERSNLLDEALARRDRLVAHERDLRNRVAEIEGLLEAMRGEIAAHDERHDTTHDEGTAPEGVAAVEQPGAEPAQRSEMADTG